MTEPSDNLRANLRIKFGEDFRRLESANETFAKSIVALEDKHDALTIENKLLREQIRLLRLAKYGPKSEQLSDRQMEFMDKEPGFTVEELVAEAALPQAEKRLEAKPRKPHPGRTELPAHLPRVLERIVCPPELCVCGQCHGVKTVIGFEVREVLDMEPVKLFVRRIETEKRACPKCPQTGVSEAPLPQPRIVEKGKASNRVIVEVLISKYCNHLPLYRQSAIWERDFGVEIDRATLCGWMMQCGFLLEAVCRSMREDLLAGGYIQADETPVGVQSERTIGKNHQAYAWQYSRPGGPVVFDFQMGRGREGPRKFLGLFNGCLQCDGYSAYDCIGGEGICFAGCMAHVRRGFVEALALEPGHVQTTAILALIAQLYGIEKEAREKKLTNEQRAALRGEKSVPILAELKKKVIETRQAALPQSALGKACDYTLNQWERLLVFTTRGQVEIDNNRCENSMRPLALGRKNWLHIGSEPAGPRVAAIVSVIATCLQLELNPREYLLDVLPRLASWPIARIAEMTPMAWAKTRHAEQEKPAAAV